MRLRRLGFDCLLLDSVFPPLFVFLFLLFFLLFLFLLVIRGRLNCSVFIVPILVVPRAVPSCFNTYQQNMCIFSLFTQLKNPPASNPINNPL